MSCGDLSSDGWEEVWSDYVVLPEGYIIYEEIPEDPDDFLKKRFPKGNAKFEMNFDTRLRKFVVKRKRLWAAICNFPKGHALRGSVVVGQELKLLKQMGENYKLSRSGEKFYVQQKCPCGLTSDCSIHIFPANVKLTASFRLAIYDDKQRTSLATLFRKNHAMTFDEVLQFFSKFKLNWKILRRTNELEFRMVCKCGEAFKQTPCNKCALKRHRKCQLCDNMPRTRMLVKDKDGKAICSDCKAAEISLCKFCEKNTRLDHKCDGFDHEHVSFRKNTDDDPLLRRKNDRHGYCPDCKEKSNYTTYPRHSQRRHNDKAPCGLYDRNYRRYYCKYCWYYHFDSTNVKQHAKLHVKKDKKRRLGKQVTLSKKHKTNPELGAR